jgi:hypothetical protein
MSWRWCEMLQASQYRSYEGSVSNQRVTPSINQCKRWCKNGKWSVSSEKEKRKGMKTSDNKIGLAFPGSF